MIHCLLKDPVMLVTCSYSSKCTFLSSVGSNLARVTQSLLLQNSRARVFENLMAYVLGFFYSRKMRQAYLTKICYMVTLKAREEKPMPRNVIGLNLTLQCCSHSCINF